MIARRRHSSLTVSDITKNIIFWRKEKDTAWEEILEDACHKGSSSLHWLADSSVYTSGGKRLTRAFSSIVLNFMLERWALSRNWNLLTGVDWLVRGIQGHTASAAPALGFQV